MKTIDSKGTITRAKNDRDQQPSVIELLKRKLSRNTMIAIAGIGGLVSAIVLADPVGISLNQTLARVRIAGGEFTSHWRTGTQREGDNFEATITTSGPFEVQTQHAHVEPGGQFGWHFHPGIVLGEVVSGTLTFYEGDDPACTPHRYGPGQGFAENGGHVHNSRNEGTQQVDVYFTYVMPPDVPRSFLVGNPGVCAFRGF